MDSETESLRKGHALIRSVFGVDPETLTEHQYANRLTEAIYIKERDKETMKTAVLEALEIGGIIQKKE